MGESLTKTPLVGMILSQAQLKNFPPKKETPLPASLLLVILFSVLPGLTLGHGVAEGDASFLQQREGFHFWPYFYLGAKHMVTGYDHLLFLAGVVFFVHRLSDVVVYVSLFALGHTLTLISGVFFDVPANVYLVDAVIGISVIYKAAENLGALESIGLKIDPKAAVFGFGLIHGLGLATKLQEISISEDGLLGNLLAFNVGVEVGQILGLSFLVIMIFALRTNTRYRSYYIASNVLIMTGGIILTAYQLTGYAFLS